VTQINELIKTITQSSKNSARSQQKKIGPSEFGGCARKLWYKLNDQEKTNPNTLSLASILGTGIHSHLQKIFHEQDPWGDRFILEGEFEFPEEDLVGHVDMYDKENAEVIDWKTSTKSNLGRYFPSKAQRWQVQLYGLLVNRGGHDVKTVTLVGIPRDGDERDIVYHSEPFDPEVCKEALAWLKEVREATTPPPAEKDASFCKHYCGFYDATGEKGCVGRPKAEAVRAVIEDNALVNAAHDYLQVSQEMEALSEKKDSIRATLEGVNGITPEGVVVSWSTTAGRKTLDEEHVAYFFEKHLEPIPYKVGKESARLTVKK
jgi:hypothetical protein